MLVPPRCPKAAVIRGGKSDTVTQNLPIDMAMNRLEREGKVKFTRLNPECFHKEGQEWDLENIVDNVIFDDVTGNAFDFHIIATHPHQVRVS